MTKSFFEIRKVEGQEPFFQIGKLFVFKMMCELYQFANERFITGIAEIDNIATGTNLEVNDYELLQENGDTLLFETNALTPIVQESYNLQDENHSQIGADNNDFTDQVSEVLDFSERNPFGEVFQ